MTAWVDHARQWVPRRLRHWLQRFVSLGELKERWRSDSDPLAGVEASDDNPSGCPIRIGILQNRAMYHTHYVRACLDLGLPFRVIDLGGDGWLSALKKGECSLFLAWPDATQTPWAKVYKDRCDVIEHELGLTIVPSSRERWMYEDKFRLRDWLVANEIPHPRTWVFTRREEARAFATECALPIVFKTGFGGAAAGVQIVRTRRALLEIVRKAFGRGHAPAGHDHRDREWGRLLLQEYLPEVREWRMVRIGDSYFGHPKGRVGDFHSGSKRVEWDSPSWPLLDLLHRVTEVGGFRSMDVDVFETPDGRLLVNELQTVFGTSTSVDQMRKDGVPGRMARLAESGSWVFEPGDFARNACANERIRDALNRHCGFALPVLEVNS
jgi:hypothetical protein